MIHHSPSRFPKNLALALLTLPALSGCERGSNYEREIAKGVDGINESFPRPERTSEIKAVAYSELLQPLLEKLLRCQAVAGHARKLCRESKLKPEQERIVEDLEAGAKLSLSILNDPKFERERWHLEDTTKALHTVSLMIKHGDLKAPIELSTHSTEGTLQAVYSLEASLMVSIGALRDPRFLEGPARTPGS